MAPAELSRLIKLFSSELGFNHCGIARAEKLNDHKSRLKDWLDSGFNGTMGYMERNFELRTNPTLLVEGARAVVGRRRAATSLASAGLGGAVLAGLCPIYGNFGIPSPASGHGEIRPIGVKFRSLGRA